ncbi:MAG TPA: MSMEG_0565 family glycosyltransferase [Polyangiaceae bacterium]|jgi:glycosyltransferase-like protein|nr:MSMEG_0565 family glycosyltransferase [Polyangiaceae bacterium]
MSRPSLGLFTYSTAPRGSVVHAAFLAEAMTELGWDVTLYALDKDGGRFFRDVRAKVRLVPAAAAPTTTAELVKQRAEELARYVRDVAPKHDVHHAEDCLTANGLLAARDAGVRLSVVRTVHHVEKFTDPYLAACQERSIRRAALCLAVSRTAELDVERGFGVRCARVSNGVSVARFARRDEARIVALRARYGLGDEPVVLAVGGVEPRKNTLCTLRAFVRVLRREPTARLVVAGGATVLDHGEYRARYEAELAALPAAVRARVYETGVLADDDVPSFFHLARALCFPSVEEGFGLVALEALAAGLPVVTSAVPPLTEFLDDSVAALVDPHSDEAVATAVLRAFDAPSAQLEAGRVRATSYSWERVARLHADAYQAVMSAPAPRRTSLESTA